MQVKYKFKLLKATVLIKQMHLAYNTINPTSCEYFEILSYLREIKVITQLVSVESLNNRFHSSLNSFNSFSLCSEVKPQISSNMIYLRDSLQIRSNVVKDLRPFYQTIVFYQLSSSSFQPISLISCSSFPSSYSNKCGSLI